MQKQNIPSRLLNKKTIPIIGVMFIFIIFAFFINWFGTAASTKQQESYSPKPYSAPKQALIFKEEEKPPKDVTLLFDQVSQANQVSDQKEVVFEKVRNNDGNTKERTYDFSVLAIIFIVLGIVLSFAIYSYHVNDKNSQFKIETVKK